MCKSIERGTWKELKEILADPIPPVDINKTAEYVCKLFGQEPRQQLALPEISPALWRSGGKECDSWIFDAKGDTVCQLMGSNVGPNKVLILAAADLRKAAYEAYRGSANWMVLLGYALDKADVKI